MQLGNSDWAYVNERAEHFIGREWVFDRVRTFLASEARILVIVAPPGTGKTAIAARLAQASAGRPADEAALPVPEGTIDAAVFCQANRVSLLKVAQDLADQLTEALEGFAEEQRRTVAPHVFSSSAVSTGDVAPGGTVIGNKFDLARLGPENAFDAGLRVPLERLADKGVRRPIVLVDSLDEAYASDIESLPGRLAALAGVRVILTTRVDRRVLAQLNLETTVASGEAALVHLIDDAPPGIDEVADYALARMRGHGTDEALATLARRIAEAAEGNFLYAYFVVGGLLGSSALNGLDALGAREQPLPEGLAGVYLRFFSRELGSHVDRWEKEVRPILAPLAVALGEGFDRGQLADIGSNLAPGRVSETAAGDVIRLAGQFLQGPLPKGPFRVYHQSFAEFLLDEESNPDWAINAVDTHRAIVDGLTPRDAVGTADWSHSGVYARTHLATHAANSGRLDALLTDPGFLVVADVERLLPSLVAATSRAGKEAAVAVKFAAGDLRSATDVDRSSYLELAARACGADDLADRLSALFPDRPWRVPLARWRRSAHVRVHANQGGVVAVATWEHDGETLLISGGQDGSVRLWDVGTLTPRSDAVQTGFDRITSIAAGVAYGPVLAVAGDSGVRLFGLPALEPLTKPRRVHKRWTTSASLFRLDGKPVLVTGGDDRTTRISELPTLSPIGRPLQGHEWAIAAAAVGGSAESILVTADSQGAVRAWRWPSLKPRARLRAADGQPVSAISISEEDGRCLIALAAGDGLTVWDLDTEGEAAATRLAVRGVSTSAVAFGDLEGRLVVISAGTDEAVRIWDLHTQAPVAALQGHAYTVNALAFGEIGGATFLISGGADDTLRLWDLADIQILDQVTDVIRPISAIASTKLEDRAVMVAAGEKSIDVRDLSTLDLVLERYGEDIGSAVALAAAVSGDKPVLASLDDDGTLRVRDLGTLDEIADRPGDGQVGYRWLGVANRNGRPLLITSSSVDGGVLWASDLRSLDPVGAPMGAIDEQSRAVAFARIDGHAVVVTGGWGRLTIRDLKTLSPITSSDRIWIDDFAVGSVDGAPVLITLSLRTISVLNLATLAIIGEHEFEAYGAAVAAGPRLDRPELVTLDHDAGLQRWNLQTLEPTGAASREVAGNTLACGFLGRRPVVAIAGGGLEVRDFDTLALVTHRNAETYVAGLAIGMLNDRSVLVTIDGDGGISVLDLETLDVLASRRGRGFYEFDSVAVGYVDGHPLVMTVGGEGLRTWDLATLAPIAPLGGFRGGQTAMTVGTIDGRDVVVTGIGDAIAFWDFENRVPVGDPIEKATTGGTITFLAVGELNGRTVIVSGGWDEPVRIWDYQTRTSVAELSIPGATGVAFADRTSLVVGARQGSVVLQFPRLSTR